MNDLRSRDVGGSLRRGLNAVLPASVGPVMSIALLMTLMVAACAWGDQSAPGSGTEQALNGAAEDYVKLVLAVGRHDPDYVDAYYGPAEWKRQVEGEERSVAELAAAAHALLRRLEVIKAASVPRETGLRHAFLLAQVRSVVGRLRLLQGLSLRFDEESKLLYDVVLQEMPVARADAIREKLAGLLPGEGRLGDRVEKFENRFLVPRQQVEAVMRAATAECRRRTRARIPLPAGEDFVLEFVTGKPWSAYNWYKGGARSVIQVNLDLPFRISQAILLAAHEGYPGHHVYNALLEENLVRKRGWVEYQVYPLSSPQSVIAEGSADFGVEVVFPLSDRIEFMRDVLFPIAGLDPAQAARYCEVSQLAEFELAGVQSQILRRYLDGGLARNEALRRCAVEALIPNARAEKGLDFAGHYRAYLTTYPVGYALVKGYVERHVGTPPDEGRRWEVLRGMLSLPMLPAGLRGE